MQTAEIRRRFLDHFVRHDHTVVPSAPLLYNDPTLLFVGAGMVPFKPYFTGQETPPFPRATSVQKCLRTNDIEEVGKTSRHLTFFQMCGNFSFGDYFKQRAIELAWELVTKPVADGGYGLDPGRLWPSVYVDDVESIDLWSRLIGVPDERIVRRGKADNYWSMGVPGPCGPDSEIFFDRGPKYGPEGGPAVDEDRYLEIWNLVFMQHVRGEGIGKDDYEIISDLPARNIDTGLGLERMASVLQGVDNLYEIDEVFPVIARAAELSERRYGADPGDDVRFRVVADHVRSALMLIGDGVSPGNEGRGYVLRRLIRRAVRSMRLLGVDEPALPELLVVSKTAMARSYPELDADWGRISSLAYAEEEAFRQTLRTGTQMFDLAVSTAKAQRSGLSGGEAFRLHDTYGFPIDLTLEMAAEEGVAVDEAEFTRLMQEQRARAKNDSAAKKARHGDAGIYREIAARLAAPVRFTGYDEVVSEGTVRGIVADAGMARSASAGSVVEVVLDRTPFYAEGGGQLADHGVIELGDGTSLRVLDVQSPIPGLITHHAEVVTGELRLDVPAVAQVDVERRRSVSRSHTATHMVHKAFREALGETATQAGSENSPGRFRFDFAATAAVPASVLADVEAKVNDLVLADLGVSAEIMSQQQARDSGAMALFGEKYGDEVRVVSVGTWARELCGGTHAGRSGQLGVVKLLGESSIGSGVRRVEALVGADAYRFLAREHVLVGQLSEALKARPEELPERVHDLLGRLRAVEKEIEQMRQRALLDSAAELAGEARYVDGMAFVGHRVEGATVADARTLALDVRGRLPSVRPAIVTVVATGPKPAVVVAVNDAAQGAGLSANDLVKVAAGVLGGSGGGKADVAQGGGVHPEHAEEALRRVEQELAAARAR